MSHRGYAKVKTIVEQSHETYKEVERRGKRSKTIAANQESLVAKSGQWHRRSDARPATQEQRGTGTS